MDRSRYIADQGWRASIDVVNTDPGTELLFVEIELKSVPLNPLNLPVVRIHGRDQVAGKRFDPWYFHGFRAVQIKFGENGVEVSHFCGKPPRKQIVADATTNIVGINQFFSPQRFSVLDKQFHCFLPGWHWQE